MTDEMKDAPPPPEPVLYFVPIGPPAPLFAGAEAEPLRGLLYRVVPPPPAYQPVGDSDLL